MLRSSKTDKAYILGKVVMSVDALPGSFNLAKYCLAENVKNCPDKTALIFTSGLAGESEAFTYTQIEDKALKFGAWLLSNGLKKGDRVFLKLKTGPEFVSGFFGCILSGVIPIPVSPLLTTKEMYSLVDLVNPSMVFVEEDDNIRSLLAPPSCRIVTGSDIRDAIVRTSPGTYQDTGPEDPAFMVFTSGTTATPRAVVHAQRVILGRKPMFAGWSDISASDLVLHAGALNWTYPLGIGLLDVFCASATALFYTGQTNPEIWPDLINQSGATIFAAFPSLYRRILKYGDLKKIKQSRLRHCLSAGEPLPGWLWHSWQEKTGQTIYESLGMSEISTYISSSSHEKPRPGSPGKAQKGRRVSVLCPETLHKSGEIKRLKPGHSGLLAVHKSDPGLFLGLFRSGQIEPLELTDEWFVTGDMVRVDEDGYFWYEGRGDEIMNASGYRVSPYEVEATLSKAQNIADLAVSEVEVKKGLRVIMAFVVLGSGGREENVRRELEELSSDLASYKRPRDFKFLKRLPRTANGKLKRDQIFSLSS